MKHLTTASIVLLAPFWSQVHAFWRMGCSIIQSGRIDPLVNPGAIAAHSHTIVGGSSMDIGINSTYDSLLNSACTSCEIMADKSAYWTPQLYYEYENKSYFEVYHSGSVAYYLGRGPNANNIVPFPKGFMILSGDKSARSYDNKTMTWGNASYPARPIADRVSFACLSDSPSQEQPYMWKTNCTGGLRAQIHFQSCWNGKDLYKADNSHVAYQSRIDDGVCPPDYPIQLPHIFLETDYSVNNVPNRTPKGRFVFSQGDPTGYGFHGDFLNGWDMDVQQAAVPACLITNNAGQISACPPLYASQTSAYGRNCPEMPPQINESVHGLLTKLPGCITITDGPEPAPAASMNCGPGIAQPAIAKTVDSTPLKTLTPTIVGQTFTGPDQVYLGCFNDTFNGVRALDGVYVSNATGMTVEYCMAYCQKNGYRLSGVEYAQECHCSNTLAPQAQLRSRGCNMNCVGTMNAGGDQELCGGAGYINIYNNTDPSFVANGKLGSGSGSTGGGGSVSNPSAPLSPLPANYVGCYTDVSPRTLSGVTMSADNMTADVCAAFCQSGNKGVGYQYYGTEYARQCYCGNTIQPNGSLLTSSSSPSNSSCKMRCMGDSSQICGGSSVLSLYKSTTYEAPVVKSPIGKYISKGCVSDPNTDGRALQGASTSSSSMTADACVKFCLGKRFRYAGVEYGQECYCDNSIQKAPGVDSHACNSTQISNFMSCAGNKLQICGGSKLMNLYYSATL